MIKGHMVIVINGVLIHDDVQPYFKGSYADKPKTLKGIHLRKLALFQVLFTVCRPLVPAIHSNFQHPK